MISNPGALVEARHAQHRLMAQIRSVRERQRETIREGVGTAISTMVGVGLGYFSTAYPDQDKAGLLGFPIALIVGVSAFGAAMAGVGGADSDYLADVGRGALAVWGYRAGADLGHPSAQGTPKPA